MVRFAFALADAVQAAPSHTISEYVRLAAGLPIASCPNNSISHPKVGLIGDKSDIRFRTYLTSGGD